jgi:tRNA(Ile2)-agmatinylcytidine synthase
MLKNVYMVERRWDWMKLLWIGVDDTDSVNGGCTTYWAVTLMEELRERWHVGLPRLIRLNPTIPYKTRGNGAVAIPVWGDIDIEELADLCRKHLDNNCWLDDRNTNPGLVIVEEIHEKLRIFAKKALRDVMTYEEAMELIEDLDIQHYALRNGRGVVGALAAVGLDVRDPTYELLTYRHPSRFGTQREVDRNSVFKADEIAYPLVWDTVDRENDEVVFTPGSPDPVLFGIRGKSVFAIIRAFLIIRSEEIDKFQLFITNQSTDMHLIPEKEVDVLRDYRSYRLKGVVIEKPYTHIGGHVFFYLETRFGKVKCAAYEPTKQFRNVIRALHPGDEIVVYGSMKKRTVNLEKIEIIKLAKIVDYKNPVCWVCGKSMESAGKNQGFRCKRCKTSAESKIEVEIPRELSPGLYEVPPRARRHISMPLIRVKGKNIHPFR